MTQAVFVFALIIAAMAAIGVGIVLSRETLQVRWRAWMVEQLVDRWLGRQRFYHLNVTGKEPPNPEYRISDDTRWATEPLVDLGIGLLLAVVGAAAFISILWTVGGSYTLDLGLAGTITIPAYMVMVALAYGFLASGLMLWVGAPLVGFVGRKNEAEGYFRFAMMRIRDNAESVALMNGARYEQAMLGRFYETVVARWMAIVWQHGHLTWITNASRADDPHRAVAVRRAEVHLRRAHAGPGDAAGRRLRAGADRHLLGGRQLQPRCRVVRLGPPRHGHRRCLRPWTADRRDLAGAAHPVARAATTVRLTDFEIADGTGRPLLSGAELSAGPGEAVHVHGESSTGKSTLVRVLAGLWPSERGELTMPDRRR